MFWNSRVSRSTSAWISVALLEPVGSAQRRRPGGCAAATRMAVERRPQVVAERGQQRRLQLLALPGQLAGLALLEELRALDGDGHHAGQRVERAGLDGPARPPPAARSAWSRPAAARAAPSRPSTVASSGGRRRCGRRRRTRAWSAPRRTPIESSPGVERDRARRRRRRPTPPSRGSAMATNVEVEPAGHRPGQRRQRLAAVGDHQHVAAQVEQPGQLVAPADRLARSARCATAERLLATRLTARNDEQRHPVLRVGDGEGADRRQEEEVEGQHRHDRRRDRDPQARGRRHDQHDHQQRRRDGGGVGDVQPPGERERHRADRAELRPRGERASDGSRVIERDHSRAVPGCRAWRASGRGQRPDQGSQGVRVIAYSMRDPPAAPVPSAVEGPPSIQAVRALGPVR